MGVIALRILDDIPCEIDPEEVFQTLHLKAEHPYASELRTLIDRARELARPRAVYQVAFVEQKGTDSVVIVEAPEELDQASGQRSSARQSPSPGPSSSTLPGEEPGRARFVSRVLRANLDQVGRVFPYIATCGHELDSVSIANNDLLGQFCWDTIKEMVLYVALSHLGDHLKEVYALEPLNSMNPGSGDVAVWPIEQQKELFSFFGDVQKLIGVDLTSSCLMLPNKSVSGIFYSSEHDFQSCQLCHREKCPQRRAPFDPHLWEERFGEQSTG
jgi:hypothetical protein